MLISARSTKEQILSLLKQNGSMTIINLAKELDITEMAVRRHIQSLERDKLICSKVKKQTMGRPSKVYQLAEEGENLFPKRYKEFSLELLYGLKEAGHEKLIKDILLKRKQHLLKQYESNTKNTPLGKRVESLIQIQRQEGYMPEIEHKNEQIHIKELNCPYVDIAKEFPQVCHAEREFMKQYLGYNLQTHSSMANGQSCCHYTVLEKLNK